MDHRKSAPSEQEQRLAVYMDGLAGVVGHADRQEPLKNYCKGLLLPGERKSVEPMAARLASDNVGRMHQSMHHLVADSPWDDKAMLSQVRAQVLPPLTKRGPVQAWIIDDTGFPKKGTHSVGVGHQYCGQTGKKDNCQIAVSLSVSTAQGSLPVAWRLYLPQDWAADGERREQAGVPEEITFQTKPKLALEQIEDAVAEGIPPGVVLADAAYGVDSHLRAGIAQAGLDYIVGVTSSLQVWKPGEQASPTKKKRGRRPPSAPPDEPEPSSVSVKELAMGLPARAWKKIQWRQGSDRRLQSRFAAVRVRPNYSEPNQGPSEEWLLIEWPSGEDEPTKYWFSNLPANIRLTKLVRLTKHRWIIERDYQELKQELGLGHYEGRGWRGFHHHATLCIAAYGFLVAERSLFFFSTIQIPLRLSAAQRCAGYRPRGAADPSRAA